jgi:hypothetical protein
MNKLFLFLLCIPAAAGFAQLPVNPYQLQLSGTRSWIKAEWKDDKKDNSGFNIYWSTSNKKPLDPSMIVPAEKRTCYIQPVEAETTYFVWIESFNKQGKSKAIQEKAFTTKAWAIEKEEAAKLDISSSMAVPTGMQLFWHDEFNDSLLNRNKWFTDYYSSIDFLNGVQHDELLNNTLPTAAYTLNGNSITLFVNDSLPQRAFNNGKKISSIQTYDWATNENLLDNSRGGYFEVRVKRNYTGHPEGLNTAYWFDSPGPDLKYYLQQGTEVNGTKGIRPKGQLFEIDVFENLDAQFVMHGHVDSTGRFIHNLATDIATGFQHRGEWVTHGMLWTPTSIKHYINGKLIKSYDNKHEVYSPNHFMNVFLGSYGKGGSVSMEVDYIRGYQWPLSDGNELPNPGFEYSGTSIAPWEGSGAVSASARKEGQFGLLLQPGQNIEQYVYLNNTSPYALHYWHKGNSTLKVTVDNMAPVSGVLETITATTQNGNGSFKENELKFATGEDHKGNMKTIRVAFTNTGNVPVLLDDITVRKDSKK